MFEKEAEEWRNNEYFPSLYDNVSEVWQEGAEFGYKKANEWHYVKDELPPIKKEYNGRSELVLVLSKEKEMQYAQYVEKEKTWARGICEISFVPYAWKEIVLPKESEQMNKKELKGQLKSYEGYINDIPLVIDPCKQCKVFKENKGYELSIKVDTCLYKDGRCKECCWFYDSKFEVGV